MLNRTAHVNAAEQRRKAAWYALAFVGCGVGRGLLQLLSEWLQRVVGERLATVIRTRALANMLRQEMAWHDGERPNTLANRLVSKAALVQEAVTARAAGVLFGLLTVSAGFAIAFIQGWRLSVVLAACFPLLVGVLWWSAVTLTLNAKQAEDSYEDAGAVAAEGLCSMDTVAAFSAQQNLLTRFGTLLGPVARAGVRSALTAGLSAGANQAVLFGMYALAFWYGALLVERGQLSVTALVQVFFAVMMAGSGLAQVCALVLFLSVIQPVNCHFSLLQSGSWLKWTPPRSGLQCPPWRRQRWRAMTCSQCWTEAVPSTPVMVLLMLPQRRARTINRCTQLMSILVANRVC